MKSGRAVMRATMMGFAAFLLMTLAVPNGGVFGAEQTVVVTPTDPTPAKPDPSDYAMMERMSRVSNYIARTASQSVVHITAKKVAKPRREETDDEVFRRFFPDDRFAPFFRFGPQPRPEPQIGLGSGVIIDPQGYIVTNNHVIEGADTIKILLPDGREFVPQWVRTDPPTDVALIKVNATDLPYLEMADSDRVQVGDWVMAIGNPFGLDNTVTQGIISYVGRGVPISPTIKYSNYIQTDAAINPGNSGGPLVNLHGKIIAINTAIVSRTATYAGIGFAIPINTVKFVTSQLKDSEQVVRSYLGVSIQDLNLPLARHFGRTDTAGALVGEVTTGSPADKAGLKAGDIILELDGVHVRNSQALQNLVAERRPGKTIRLKLWRDRKMLDVPVTLERMPKEFFASRATPRPNGEETETGRIEIAELGITVSSVTSELAEKYNLKTTQPGAMVIQVDSQGEGAQRGLSEGDLILQVEGQKIAAAKDLSQALRKFPLKKGVTMYVKSPSGGARYIYFKID